MTKTRIVIIGALGLMVVKAMIPTNHPTPVQPVVETKAQTTGGDFVEGACRAITKLTKDIDSGIAGAADLRPRLQDMYSRYRFDPQVEPSLKAMLHGVTNHNTKEFKHGVDEILNLCITK